jgi:hypothetical protein
MEEQIIRVFRRPLRGARRGGMPVQALKWGLVPKLANSPSRLVTGAGPSRCAYVGDRVQRRTEFIPFPRSTEGNGEFAGMKGRPG